MGKYQKPAGFWRSFFLAWRGLIYTWKTQGHLRFHVFAGLIVLAGGWWVQLSRWEWTMLIFAMGSVMAAEVMNTAIEFAVDLVEPNFHPLAGIVKDVAAGAVLITVIQAVIIGNLIFGPPLIRWVKSFFMVGG